MERVLFTNYPEHDFDRTAPMEDSPLYKWLSENVSKIEESEKLNDIDYIKKYLSIYGYDFSKNIICSRGLGNLKDILQYFFNRKYRLEKGTTMDKQILLDSIKTVIAREGIIVRTNGGKEPLIPYIVGEGVGDFITKVTANTIYIETIYQYGNSVKEGRYEKLDSLNIDKLRTILDYIK